MSDSVYSYSNFKLYYFDLPGKGEPIRLACYSAGIPLEDIRLSFDQFKEMKNQGELQFGQVPCLVATATETATGKSEDIHICQSASIMRFLGRISFENDSYTTLYPADNLKEATFIDSLLDQEIDMFTGLTVSRYQGRFGFGFLAESPELVKKVRKALNDEVLPRHLSFFETILTKSVTGWLSNASDSPTIIDYVLVPRLQWLASGTHDGIPVDIITKNFPLLTAYMEKFENSDFYRKYYGLDNL